jgi:hypothetical protein
MENSDGTSEEVEHSTMQCDAPVRPFTFHHVAKASWKHRGAIVRPAVNHRFANIGGINTAPKWAREWIHRFVRRLVSWAGMASGRM